MTLRWFPAMAALLVGAAQPAVSPVSFSDATASARLAFTHHNGADGRHLYPELFGGGVVVLDIDSDAWPDLLFVDSKDWPPAGRPARHGLFRNNRDGTFTDVLAGSGLQTANVYGLGGAAADYDNDGRDDLFLTTVDGGRLFRGIAPGRFSDVTEQSGVRNTGFAVSAAWLDFDRDGLLDLFIGNYVQWSPALEVRCGLAGERGYCGPNSYKPASSKLYRNAGSGRFEDVTARTGLDAPTDKAMGVAVLDYNGDRWPDIFVGNDRVPAKLYRNDGRGKFVNEALQAGVALSETGAARANMGVDAADYDRSGRPSLLVGNFINEMLGLYRNVDGGGFVDVAPRSEIGRASLLSVTWGVFFADYDLDGWLDIFAANGGTDESQVRDSRARVSQPPLLMRNRRDGTFENVTASLGASFNRPLMARGAAYLDFDGDGDLDIAIGSLAGPAVLYRNDGGNSHHWLRVRTVGAPSNRSGIGAVVRVTTGQNPQDAQGTQAQTVHSGASYASQSELTLTFGLGRERTASRVAIEWPSGRRQAFDNVMGDRTITIDETRGLVR